MIARFGLLTRNPALTPEAFDRHWRDAHGPLAARMPGMRAYYQHLVVDSEQFGISHERGAWKLDGFSELRFDTLADMTAAVKAERSNDAHEDLGAFLDGLYVVACEKHTVVPVDTGDGPFVKRMTLLRRLDGMTPEEFRREWLEVHAAMVRKWPNVLGYVQNLVVDRFHGAPTESVGHDVLPVDGIVEFRFRDKDEAAALYASEIVARTQAHAREFLAEITPFFVETRQIL